MAIDPRLLTLPAAELASRLASGALRASDLAEASLMRIAEREEAVGAFAWFDTEFVRRQARILDEWRGRGRALGPLHGLPVAVVDTIDTARVPTRNGTPADAQRVPEADAAIMERLRAAGALLIGKTETAELGYRQPPRTRNPVNPAHTPGVASSGSAAAVGAGMVPLAVGVEGGGSVIGPAAYCGSVGYKPSFGSISRRGTLALAPSLDTPGVFAADVASAAMLAEALFGYDAADPATSHAPHPRLLDAARSAPPVKPTFALVRTPFWDQASADTQGALGELAEHLAERCFEAELPAIFAECEIHFERVLEAEMARNLVGYGQRHGALLSAPLRETLERGGAILARDYLAAKDWQSVYRAGIMAILDRCDAILTPAAPGPAPEGLDNVGSPVFNRLWTFAGLPTITLPLLEAENGLPMGVQLVGRLGEDARLLRAARWLEQTILKGGTPE
ncbi:MAG TPA: amidase [Aurantimonas coralicida]|uniref:Amidase n=2 Tax=root TaxID=1 RepID=A0A9C9NK93_9HYPH|nr:amidase [Aurantimonas coralicida]HEU03134.1 amidase [Aurantimonas coralicida]